MIRCKTCDDGELVKRKAYRMGGVVVLIGYILLIPSLLGMAGSGMMCVATGAAAGGTFEQIEGDARAMLTTAQVPADVVEETVAMRPLSDVDRARLTPEQVRVVNDARRDVAAGSAGAGVGIAMLGGSSAFLFMTSLVGGLLGWLLVMKKRVLQCKSCGAVTAAS